MIKRLAIKLLVCMLLTITLPICNNFNHVYADELYPIACNINEFEVSNIEDDGSLSKVSCHASFVEAKTAMKANNDYVVRYAKSFSPTKIVAMNSGFAYTYPGRSNSSTMNLYQSYEALKNNYRNNNYKYTYLTNHYEMTYYDTLDISSSSITDEGRGYIKISMNGFNGYTDLQYTDLVPSKYVDNGIAIWLGGNNVYEEDEDEFLVKITQNYYQIETNGNYDDLVFHYFRAYPTNSVKGGDAISGSIHIDNAANYLKAGMQKGVKYYSNDGINFYSDTKLQNFVARVFGYYQYLSLRTKTSIEASTFDKFLKTRTSKKSQLEGQGQAFINAQNNYGSNALIVYAMACLESGYGTSGYALNRNNLFGWSAYDADPDNASYYDSIEEGVNYQMGENLDWFMDYSNWRYNGTCVGSKGTGFNVNYASDPYWGAQIGAIAYSIDKFNNNNNGKLTDYNKYAIGFVKDNYNDCFYEENSSVWNVNIYGSAYGNDSIYTSKFSSHYQNNLLIAINERIGNRYKFNLPNPVIDGDLYYDSGIVKYDWDKSIGYINCDNVVLTNDVEIPTEKKCGGFVSLRSASIDNNILTISGIGGMQGFNFDNTNNIVHEVVFNDANNPDNKYSYIAENIDSNGYSLNDGYSYKYTGFNLSLDLSAAEIPNGSYYLTLNTYNDDYYSECTLRNSNERFSNIVSNNNNLIYRFTTNSLYNYRLEFDKFNSELNYSQINKPTSRTSLASLDGIEISDEGLLTISAHGLIYYLNYDNKSNIEYKLYLLKEDGSSIEMNTIFRENRFDYKSQFNSSYNMDNISFTSTTDVSELDGVYTLILKIKNGNYIDYVEFPNRSHTEMPSKSNEKFDIKILTSNIRNRLYIECESKGE